MTKYPFPKMSKKQKQIIDQLSAGNYSLSSVFPTKSAPKVAVVSESVMQDIRARREEGDSWSKIASDMNIGWSQKNMAMEYDNWTKAQRKEPEEDKRASLLHIPEIPEIRKAILDLWPRAEVIKYPNGGIAYMLDGEKVSVLTIMEAAGKARI